MALRLKVTSAGGTAVLSVPGTATWDDLLAAAAASGLTTPGLQSLAAKAGFPPKALTVMCVVLPSFQHNGKHSCILHRPGGKLVDSGVASGSMLALSASVSPPVETPAATPAVAAAAAPAEAAAAIGTDNTPLVTTPEVWACGNCTLHNPWSSTECAVCTAQQPADVAAAKAAPTEEAAAGSPPPRTPAACMKRVVLPADNNCLFTAVAYLQQGGCSDKGAALRQAVAAAVTADPVQWNEGVLGKSTAEYVAWITQGNETWGGAIELAVLAGHFGTTLVAMDIQTGKEHRFAPPAGGDGRVAYLLYDGLHYDAAGLDPVGGGTPEGRYERTFPEGDAVALQSVQALVAEAKAARAFTDTSAFTLRCLVCQKGLVGQQGAMTHAQSTGHTNFAEFQ